MADNVQITAGSGTTMATDDIGGVHYPKSKIGFGGDDEYTAVTTTYPFPVKLPLNNFTAPVYVYPHFSTAVSASITRPNDTTAYTTGDAWTDSTSSPTASITQLTGMANSSDGSGTIMNACLIDSANQTTKGNFEVFLFTSDITLDNDNAAFTPTDGEMETCIGVISFVGTLARSGNSTSGATGNAIYTPFGFTPIPYHCDGGTTLYYAIKVANNYTPVAQEKLTLVLNIQQEY